MFGYVVVNKSELKFREYDVYHSYYCGLCNCLKKHYGAWGQMTLSYDMTFAAMLLSSLYEPETENKKCRCIAHPFQKHEMCYNEIMDYLVAMNIMLSIHKCEDDWQDEKKLSRRIFGEMLCSRSRKELRGFDHKEDYIRIRLRKISELENSGCNDIEAVADLFGEIMSEVFSYRDDEWTETVRGLGYHLGRFIYILDAYDDIEKDIRKKNYNPLLYRVGEENFDEEIHEMLTMVMADCCREFEMLPLVENVEILRNILYSGVWGKFEEVRARRAKEKNKEI